MPGIRVRKGVKQALVVGVMCVGWDVWCWECSAPGRRGIGCLAAKSDVGVNASRRSGKALGSRGLHLFIRILSDFQFQWRFSREDMHSRQMRKSKGKLSARDKRQAEENEKNLEDQFSKAGDVGNCVLSQQQEDGASEEMKVQEVTGKQLRSDSWCHVENGPAGPAGHCGAPEGGCAGHSGPGDDAREGGAEEVAAEPETAEDN